MAENKEERTKSAGKFQDAIFDYARIQSEQILQEVRKKQLEELKAAREAIQKETEDYVKLQLEKRSSKVSREMAHREQDLKRDILKKRQEITDKVFADAKTELLAFVNTAEYKDFLLELAKSARQAFQAEDTVFITRKADEAFHADIQSAFGAECSFQTTESIHIGGLQVRSASLGLMADDTLDAMLEDQREWFAMNSGLSVI